MTEHNAGYVELSLLGYSGEESGGSSVSATRKVELYFQELREPVYRYLCCCGMLPSESEEITQDTFVRLYKELSRGTRIAEVRPWLFRVAHNLLVDRTRKPPSAVLFNSEVSDKIAENFPDPSPDPEQTMIYQERHRDLLGRVAELTELQRQALYLRSEGFRYREIAEILDVHLAAVVDRVRKALKKLGSSERTEP